MEKYDSLFYARFFKSCGYYQSMPLLNLRPPVFGLTIFGYFISIYLSILFFCENIFFDLHLFD
jgi:hypothetical protein